jgi:hypothetical protein
MFNNSQQLNIWLNLKSKFDFEEFKSTCKSGGIESCPILEFAQKAGILSCAMVKYPEMPIAEAYTRLIQESIGITVSDQLPVIHPESSSPCSGCGGGKVL